MASTTACDTTSVSSSSRCTSRSPESIPVARRVTRISAPNFSAWCTIRLAKVLPSTLGEAAVLDHRAVARLASRHVLLDDRGMEPFGGGMHPRGQAGRPPPTTMRSYSVEGGLRRQAQALGERSRIRVDQDLAAGQDHDRHAARIGRTRVRERVRPRNRWRGHTSGTGRGCARKRFVRAAPAATIKRPMTCRLRSESVGPIATW